MVGVFMMVRDFNRKSYKLISYSIMQGDMKNGPNIKNAGNRSL